MTKSRQPAQLIASIPGAIFHTTASIPSRQIKVNQGSGNRIDMLLAKIKRK
jgi:hypothetical protein